MKLKNLYRELVRRNVFRAVLAYLAVAWVLIEFSSVILPTFDAPPYLLKGLIFLLAIGLIFWTGFAWVYDLTPEGWRKTPDWTDTTETRAANSRRLNTVIAVAGVTAILLLLAGSFWAGSRWSHEDTRAYSPKYRIAVLPLESSGFDSREMGYFQDGLTQDLIQRLSESQSLMVLNIGSSRFFTAGILPENPYMVANAENVDYFISGRIKKNENVLNLNMELRRRLDQNPFWTDSYESDIVRIDELISQVTTEIQQVMGLGPESEFSINREIRSIHPETYELYLKGKYYLNKSTVDEWKQGLVYLQEAIDRNPADPDAYAGMAEGYITWGHSLMPPDDVFPKALAAAKRAIQLDSLNAEGWAALADYHTYFGWDWELAEYAFRKADSLNPNMALNHYHRSWYLALFGRMDEAIAEHKRAQELDPFTPMHTAWMAELYRWLGEYEKALEELDKVFEMSTGRYALALMLKGSVLMDMGNTEEGLQYLEQASEINKGWYFFYGPALVKAGNVERAKKIIAEVKSFPSTSFFNLTLAGIYSEMGDLEQMFDHLEKGKRHAWYPWVVRIYISNDKVQQDPRYNKLLHELKLPPPAPMQYSF